jgi:hypothetical protein
MGVWPRLNLHIAVTVAAAAHLELVCCELLQLLPACCQPLLSDAVLPVKQRHDGWDALQVLLLQQRLQEAAQLVHTQPAQLLRVQPAGSNKKAAARINM